MTLDGIRGRDLGRRRRLGPVGARSPALRGPADEKNSALSASADGGIPAGAAGPTGTSTDPPRCEVVDLALPSVEDQNLDGALAAEPRHHRLRTDLACPSGHEGPGDPRAVRHV